MEDTRVMTKLSSVVQETSATPHAAGHVIGAPRSRHPGRASPWALGARATAAAAPADYGNTSNVRTFKKAQNHHSHFRGGHKGGIRYSN